MAEKKASSVSKKLRKRPVAKHRNFKLTKKRIKQPKALISPIKLIRDTFVGILSNKKYYGGVALIYAGISFVLIQGFGSTFNISETKQQLEEVIGDSGERLSTSFALFEYLIGDFSSQSVDTSGTYQIVLTMVTMLATIWLARHIATGTKPQLRDAYYKGMYPIIPFLLVTLVIGLQLLPAVIGNFIYATVLGQGLAVTALEKVIWFLLFMLLSVLSLYMITSSVFALFIATLPDTRPIQALRSARDLVMHRRLGIAARIILLPIVLTLISLVIFIPLIMIAPILVEPLFLLASAVGLVLATLYNYNLYRSLL